MKLITHLDVKKIIGGFLILAIMLGGCTNALPITTYASPPIQSCH